MVFWNRPDPKRIDIWGAMPKGRKGLEWGDLYFANALSAELSRLGFKTAVRTREQWNKGTNAGTVLVLRGRYPVRLKRLPGRRYFLWVISHPDDITIEEYDQYDYVFFASKKLREALGGKIKPPSGVLLQCADAHVMTAGDPDPEKQYELLFVGNSRQVYRKILKDLEPPQYRLTVIGSHWDAFPVSRYVEKTFIPYEELGSVYRSAKILLNDHWDDMRKWGIVSNRVFDALAAGAFVLSDDMPEIRELFGDAVATYREPEDLRGSVRYWMEHEDEKIERIERGRRIVLASHTFCQRAEKIAEVLKELS